MSPSASQPETLAEGRFQVLETLACDDLEVVRRCRDLVLGREVLVEGPGEGLLGLSAGDLDRAMREAQALARIEHPAIQRLLEVVSEGDRVLLVLEPVAGETLAERLEWQKRLSVDDTRELALALGGALASVHGAGVVHRAVSPEHVIFGSDGTVRLRGFRLAKYAPSLDGSCGTSLPYEFAEGVQKIRQLLPRYPAPEQLGGERADARSDLFGLGCLLYRCLTGKEAFDDPLSQVPPAQPSLVRSRPDLPRDLARMIDSCLARSPLGRPRDAREFVDGLRAAPGGLRGHGRRWAVGLASVAGLLLFVLVRGIWPGAGEPAPRAAEAAEVRGVGAVSALGEFQPGFRASHALLIGIGAGYAGERAFPLLDNAEDDVHALADGLRGLAREWDVRLLTGADAHRAGILAALRDLERRAQAEDRVFVFFAGHGIRHDTNPTAAWILPADARAERDDPGHSTWLPFFELQSVFAGSGAKHVLIAMDCCFGGRLVAARGIEEQRYSESYATRMAHVAISSGRDELVSDGLRGSHSPFVRHFLAALEGTGPVTSTELFAYVRRSMLADGVQQTPTLGFPQGARLGDFVFFRSGE